VSFATYEALRFEAGLRLRCRFVRSGLVVAELGKRMSLEA